jgi:hypothetical protein
MSAPIIVVTGDDIKIPVSLTTNGVAEALGVAATAKACLVSINHANKLTADITLSRGETGANWDAGLVVVPFASADTAAIDTQGRSFLEIQVTDGGKDTWFVPVTIIKGNIA